MSRTAGTAGDLAELADLVEIRGASQVAEELRRASRHVATLPIDEAARYLTDAGTGHSPTGARAGSAGAYLQELSVQGASVTLERAQARIPHALRGLLHLQSVSVAEALVLARQTAALTLPDLLLVRESGRLETALGTAAAARVADAIETLVSKAKPLTLGRAAELAESLLERLRAVLPDVETLTASGDVRRVEPLVMALVLVGRAADPLSVIERVTALPEVEDVLHKGPRRAVLLVQQVEVDLRISGAEEFGTVLFRATGAPAHVAAVERARPMLHLAASEEALYTHAGLPFIPPELRHGTGEIDAALKGRLPVLLDRADIRGDLHMHTTYSDGRDTLEAMVAAAAAEGYEYVAITDHSARAGAARTVTLDQLDRQRDELARLRERHPGLTILHGIEVDVMPDGSLDFPDSVLELLDIVLASVHDAARQDGRRLTARCLGALSHPLVNILTHPGNRIVGRRAEYPLDYPALYTAAAESGTALEIDGAPVHLDLDGARAREAVAAGATVVVNSDSHAARNVGRQMGYGVGTARRGGVEARHVLNTRPIAEVRQFIQAKRRGQRPPAT